MHIALLVIRLPYGNLHIKSRKKAGLQPYPARIVMDYKPSVGRFHIQVNEKSFDLGMV